MSKDTVRFLRESGAIKIKRSLKRIEQKKKNVSQVWGREREIEIFW